MNGYTICRKKGKKKKERCKNKPRYRIPFASSIGYKRKRKLNKKEDIFIYISRPYRLPNFNKPSRTITRVVLTPFNLVYRNKLIFNFKDR